MNIPSRFRKEEAIRNFDRPLEEDSLGARLREVRREIFGHDVESLGRRLRIAPRDWEGYEAMREPVPADVLLRFVELTGADPIWLLRGVEPRYRLQDERAHLDGVPWKDA